MISAISRREFLARGGLGLLAAAACPTLARASQRTFEIALNQLSLHRSLESQRLHHLDFARVAHQEFGLTAVEYASRFFASDVGNEKFLAEMNRRAADEGVRQLMIVVEDQGCLGDDDPTQRRRALLAHQPWIDAARHLGCHSIEVSIDGRRFPGDAMKRLVEGLTELCEYAEPRKINVLVSNRGLHAGQGLWLNRLLAAVGRPCCRAALRIHGNGAAEADGNVQQLAPLAKAVSAVTQDSDDARLKLDDEYVRRLKLVLDAGYRGYVSIQYQGTDRDESSGIRATKSLLEQIRLRDETP